MVSTHSVKSKETLRIVPVNAYYKALQFHPLPLSCFAFYKTNILQLLSASFTYLISEYLPQNVSSNFLINSHTISVKWSLNVVHPTTNFSSTFLVTCHEVWNTCFKRKNSLTIQWYRHYTIYTLFFEKTWISMEVQPDQLLAQCTKRNGKRNCHCQGNGESYYAVT